MTRLLFLFQRFLGILRYLPRAWHLVWAAAPGWVSLWLSLLVIQAVLPALSAYVSKLLIDQLVLALKTERVWAHWQPVFRQAVGLTSIWIVAELLNSLSGLARLAQSEKLKLHIAGLIQQQSVAVDFVFYERADYYDRLYRARTEASYRPLALIESLGNFLQDSLTLLAMMVLLAPFGWWLPVVLLFGTLPALVLVFRFTLRQYEWQRENTSTQRRSYYYEWLLTTSETAAEIRLFDLGAYFRKAYDELSQQLYRSRWGLAKSQASAELGAALIALLFTSAVWAWMGWQLWLGRITLGTLALFYQAFNRGQQVLRSVLGHVGQFYSNGLFLSNLFEFLELEPQVADPPTPLPVPQKLAEGIRFNNVSFVYSGSQRPVFQQFDLFVPAGRIVAIVGLNGAGKTTLIKLLCRLYDPTAGSVELDGLDLRQLKLTELRQRITVLLQQPVHFNETVRMNIQFGALQQPFSQAELAQAVSAAGAQEIIEHLPKGYETQLGKWFADGTELSLGQWQRIALARAFLRPASIVLLDEPTSAMDSWAENEWLKRFRSVMVGRTVILITHRFTTARHADVIHVMNDGQVVESGTHQELLAQAGMYAASWHEQMKEFEP